MRVAVACEMRFAQTPDGAVWTDVGSYTFWTRYLEAFDSVRVIARLRMVEEVPSNFHRVDGPGVSFERIPHYGGPQQFVIRWRELARAVRSATRGSDALILRLGTVLAIPVRDELIRSRRPFGVEVVGDPWDVFAPGVVTHPLRPLIRRYLARLQRDLCAHATAAAYVTERALQRRYPCRQLEMSVSDVELGEKSFATHYSNVELSESDFVSLPRQKKPQGTIRIVTVGSLAQRYKGVDVIISAIARLEHSGQPCHLDVVGDGKFRPELERLALDLRAPVTFHGTLGRREIFTMFDASDIFVLASRTEGLPRALIEAMARGLPCLATAVGGVPELLEPHALLPVDDSAEMTLRLRDLIGSPEVMERSSATNLRRAGDFTSQLLRARRQQFYEYLRDATNTWSRQTSCASCNS